MRCPFFVLLLFSAVSTEKCDLFELCKEKEKLKCWPESRYELVEFAKQFKTLENVKGFDALECFKDVLLNKTLPSEISLEKRIKDLFDCNSFTDLADTLVDGLCLPEEMPEYLKVIPVRALRTEFYKKKNYKCMIKLMEYQKYYFIRFHSSTSEYLKVLLDSLQEDSKNEEFSWLTNPMWMAFADVSGIEMELGKNILMLLLLIGEEVRKENTRDELKTVFILAASSFIETVFFLNDNSFFEEHELGQKTFDLLKNVTYSVKDKELRSVLELATYRCKSGLETIYSQAYKSQGFYSIQILWNCLKSIGHTNNAATLISGAFIYGFRDRYFAWNVFQKGDWEMFAAFLNVFSDQYELFDAIDIYDVINGFENVERKSAKIKYYEQDFGKQLNLLDFQYVLYFDSILKNFGTEEKPVIIDSLIFQNPDELENSLSPLNDVGVIELMNALGSFYSLPDNARCWSRSYPICSTLLKRSASVKFSDDTFLLHYRFAAYFLLDCASFSDLGSFDDGKDSLAASFLLASDLVEYRVGLFEWLFDVRKAVPALFKLDGEITGVHVELLWTYRLILDKFVKSVETGESKDKKKEELHSYIIRMFLQDFGPYAKVFDKDLGDMPLRWTLSVNPFIKATGAIAIDPTTKLDSNSEKISLIKVIRMLDFRLTDEQKWERIVDYLRSINVDFMTVKEIANELLDGISKKEQWDPTQRKFAGNLFACYNPDLDQYLKCQQKLVPEFRLNAEVLSYLPRFFPPSFLAHMPSSYESIENFQSIIVRKSKGNSELKFKADDYLPSFENALHENPEILVKSDSGISSLYDFSGQSIQSFLKELLDEQFKLFKKTKTGFYIPAWTTSREIGNIIGILLGKYINTVASSSAPFFASLDPTFLSLLLDPSNEKIKNYYKEHYTEDLDDYKRSIQRMGEGGLDKLLIPNVCHVKCTNINSINNLSSTSSDSQMKIPPDQNYLAEKYFKLIDHKMEQAFYEMILEMQKGLLMFVDKEIWNRIHKVEDIKDLLNVEKK